MNVCDILNHPSCNAGASMYTGYQFSDDNFDDKWLIFHSEYGVVGLYVKDPQHVNIHVACLPPGRGQPLRKHIKEVLRWAAISGVVEVDAPIHSRNIAAIALAKRMGFVYKSAQPVARGEWMYTYTSNLENF